MVGAVGEPDLAGRERGGAAAGRAARGQRGIPRIAGAAEHLVEGRAAGAEFRRVRLGDDNAASALDPLDHRVRTRRHMVAEDRRAVGRAHAGDIGEILDGDRQAGEPAGLSLRLATFAAHQPFGMGTRAIDAEGRQRIDRRLDLRDPPRRGVDEVERRDLAALQAKHRLGCRQPAQLIVRRRHWAPVLPGKKALGPAPGQPADRDEVDHQSRNDARGPLRCFFLVA